MGWKADYVALFDERPASIDVQGWITLTNTTGTTFTNAETLLVAGEIGAGQHGRRNYRPRQRAPQPGNRARHRKRRRASGSAISISIRCASAPRSPTAQTKQVSFLDVQGAPARKAYEFRNRWLGRADEARQRCDRSCNSRRSRSGGLGDALPAGHGAGLHEGYAGQRRSSSARARSATRRWDPSIGLKTGEAFDVKVQPVVDKREKITSDEWERTARYRVTKSDGSVTVTEVETNTVYSRTTMRYTSPMRGRQPVTVDLVQAGSTSIGTIRAFPARASPGGNRR